MNLPVYLDNHATTKPDPRVVEAMLPFMTVHYGNAASKQHEFGWRAEAGVDVAREQIAALIGAGAEEIILTSGATESINLALKGVAEANASKGNHVITAATEHKAVLDSCERLEKDGFALTVLPVDANGLVSPEDVRQAITEKTVIVSIMTANNEIGTISPIRVIGRICRERGVLFHTDATQAVGRIPIDVKELNVDLLSFSAHKMYGPKGIGALYVCAARPRIRIIPQMDGGGHERGLRSGTLNVPAVVGFGRAAAIAKDEMANDAVRTRSLRDRLVEGIRGRDVRLNGHPADRLPNNASVTFAGLKADALIMEMKDIALSSGSACSSARPELSHVLKAIGLSREDVQSTIRFGLGRFTTEEEIDYTIQRVAATLEKLRTRNSVLAG